MVRKTALPLIAALLLALSVSACGVAEDGPHTVQHRKVGGFDRIELHGSTDVVVRPGRAGNITVEGGRNRVEELTTRVEDGTLFVEQADSSGTIDLDSGEVTVVAHAPSLSGARIDGSGSVEVEQTRGPRFEAEINGSGDVSAAGRVDVLEAALDGSGNLDLGALSASDARVEISGSGDAKVDADRLDVKLSGSGDVHYSGDPELTEHVSGSGEVSPG